MSEMSRPSHWSEQVWRKLSEIVHHDAQWVKPAWMPDQFNLQPAGVDLAWYLLREGCLPAPWPAEDDAMYVPVPLADRSVMARFERRPSLTEEVGTYPDVPAIWRGLAMLDVTGHRREVRSGPDGLTVCITLPFRRFGGSDVLAELRALAQGYRDHLDRASEEPGGGYADLLATFAGAGLAMPYVPKPLTARMARLDTWCWSSRPNDAELRMADYLLESVDELTGAVEDHVTISHGGHGINSYALTWRMAFGPFAFVVQDAWGGAYGGPADNGRLARSFAHMSEIVRRAEERMESADRPPAVPWVRPVVVAYSPLRGVVTCSVWDPIRGERVTLHLDHDNPWNRVAEWIGTCDVPTVDTQAEIRLVRHRVRSSTPGEEQKS